MTDVCRRSILRVASLLALTTLFAGCGTLESAKVLIANEVSFTAPQLQDYLDKRHPQTYDQLGGLIRLNVMNPRIAIPQDSTRLHMDFDVGLDGLGMDGSRPAGHIAVTSGLRFDPGQHVLYLEEPQLESADLPLLGSRMNATGRELINGWLRDYARNEPVYRLDAQQLDTLGSRRVAGTLIQNGRITIKLDR